MSDPVRWKDGGGPDGLKELLRAAPRPRPMTAAERARTAERLARIAGGAGAGATGKLAGAAWGKGLALAAAVGVAGVLARALLPLATPPPSWSTPAQTAEVAAPSPPSPPSETPTSEAAAQRVPPKASGDAPGAASEGSAGSAAGGPRASERAPKGAPQIQKESPAKDADSLLEEAESLEKARAGLASDPAASLDELRAVTRRFPAGKLAAEREYLTIDALLRVGRRDEARARAQAFLARYPGSPYAKEVQRALAPDP